MAKSTKEKIAFVLFLVGPTAVGKSEIAVALAKKINGEIVSCDSMQVYRGMDIGTAKPSKFLRARVSHHLIDVVDPARAFNVAKYRNRAMRAIQDILKRHKTPIVVGGTGLYFRALLDGIFQGPGPQPRLRESLQEEAATKGSSWLHARLAKVDPRAAGKIHPHDVRKMIRALEVYHAAHKPISDLQRQWADARPFPYAFRVFGLDMDRNELYRRVDIRVRKMFRIGLRKEVQVLVKKGFRRNKVACQAIGYKEILNRLDRQYDGRKALELVQRNTRRFAKRQFTWFKKDARIEWVKVDGSGATAPVVREILDRLNERSVSSLEDPKS